MSLAEALRAGAPQAFEALYDEYAGALYAYCQVMVDGEAVDALRDVFAAVSRHPDAAPATDAALPVWLHALARAECVRRGALVRGVVTTGSADPLRRTLARLSPEHREVLALANTLGPEGTAQVIKVSPDTAEILVREARLHLEQAAGTVRDPAMLATLSGEALHRLVTLGHEPPAEERERILSSWPPAGRAPGGAAVFGTDGTPLPPDAFSAQADDATHWFPAISPDEPVTEPLGHFDATSADTRSDQLAFPELAGLGLGRPKPDQSADLGGLPPPVRGTHAERRKPFAARRLVPVMCVVACAAVATGVAFAWPRSSPVGETGAVVHQSASPGRSARPTPSSPSLKEASADPSVTPSPRRTTAAPSPRRTTTAGGSPSAATTPPTRSPSATPTPEPSTSAPPDAPVPWPEPPYTTGPGGDYRTTERPRPWRPRDLSTAGPRSCPDRTVEGCRRAPSS